MKFHEETISKLGLKKPDDFIKLIIEYFCGENSDHQIIDGETNLVRSFLPQLRALNYEQLNEILLVLNQDRISEDFFLFVFEKPLITMEELVKGIVKFRGFAMLCFGNFKFAYKRLMGLDRESIDEITNDYCALSKEDIETFIKRPKEILGIKKIAEKDTWYTGELNGEKIGLDIQKFTKQVEKKRLSRTEASHIMALLKKRRSPVAAVQKTAFENSEVYLCWDYMDVYIATSMRNQMEFETAYGFINTVFRDEKIRSLNLRYFDPTQSKFKNRYDKGLLEALMLKRASCCIYMAQESETLGKDSELASTLAQGKPVIAYIRKEGYKTRSQKLQKNPLSHLYHRILSLEQEGIFLNDQFRAEIGSLRAEQFRKEVKAFKEKAEGHFNKYPFSTIEVYEQDFKENFLNFEPFCDTLAIAEFASDEKRADTLMKYHPLAMQVDINTGVAHGVLVVRSEEDCSKLLYQIMTNTMEFFIEKLPTPASSDQPQVTILREKISGCPYRIVSSNIKLSNSFWNFYLRGNQNSKKPILGRASFRVK